MHKVQNYFKIQELVDKKVYQIYGERAWKFFDISLLDTLLVLRENLNLPITINNWLWKGKFTQRGLRHNKSSIVRNKDGIYLSAHLFGKAIDFDVKGMSAVDVREWILNNENKFKHKIRLENKLNGKPINWVH